MSVLRGYDIWYKEREAAQVLDNGIRDHRADSPMITATIWNPKASKPGAHYSFRSVEAREQYITQYVTDYAESQALKAQRREAAQSAGQEHANDIGVGHIFRYSWGYDQTNINYYQVIEKHGQNVVVREIAQSDVPGSHGFMSERVEPRIGRFLEKEQPFTKRVQFTPDGRAYLSFDFGWCELWRGGSSYQSHYA